MTVYALADFGSTFTKVAVVDGDQGRLLGAAQSPTTVNSDVIDGFQSARAVALSRAGIDRVDRTLAASSAAGGLRMVAVGLVDDLTARAARECALGAGARLTATCSGRLDGGDARRIAQAGADVILFAGGTDGGERDRVIDNARTVASVPGAPAVVVACNAAVAEAVREIFQRAGRTTVLVDNIMPTVHRQHPEPARSAIRELFIERVVRARGLSRAAEFFDAMIMPTPAAVLACARLIADPAGGPTGGGVVIVDVGGATTDVHSVLPAAPERPDAGRQRPPPLPAARTVEGDLGVRWGAESVFALDQQWLCARVGIGPEGLGRGIAARRDEPWLVSAEAADRAIDRALACSCLALAVARHTGRISTRYSPGQGAQTWVDGRDLREIGVVVATGGSLASDPEGARDTVLTALGRLEADRPAPRAPRIAIDREYIAAAVGLLAEVDRAAASRLLAHGQLGLTEAGA